MDNPLTSSVTPGLYSVFFPNPWEVLSQGPAQYTAGIETQSYSC